MHRYNKFFDSYHELSEHEFLCLMANRQVWVTRCRMDRSQAWDAMKNDPVWRITNPDPTVFADEERTYGGI